MCCLKKKKGNKMSTTIRKATKYFPLILENKGPSALVDCVQFELLHLKKNVRVPQKIKKDQI